MIIKNISKFFPLVLLILLTFPTTTFSYFTTNQTAQNITQNSALYTIDFTFGFANRDVYIPVMTKRDLTFTDKKTTNTLGYSFTTTDKTNDLSGTSVGLVLSSFPIENGMYKVPAGTRGYFKLVVILTKENNTPAVTSALQVDKLPFAVSYVDGKEDSFELNPSELQHYSTDAIKIGGLLTQDAKRTKTIANPSVMTIPLNGK